MFKTVSVRTDTTRTGSHHPEADGSNRGRSGICFRAHTGGAEDGSSASPLSETSPERDEEDLLLIHA